MRKLVIYFALTLAISMASLSLANENIPVIAVVVSSQQNVDQLNLSTKNLNLIYWRKQLFWPEGIRIKPVNLSAQNPLRMHFSESVLGSKPSAQTDYWNGQYFNGIQPPHSVDSEEAVLRYIAQTKGAIGYLNACHLDDRVTPVLWIYNGTLRQNTPNFTCH